MKFYSVQLRESVEIPDNEVSKVTMKNGKKAYQAVMRRDGKEYTLFRIKGNK